MNFQHPNVTRILVFGTSGVGKTSMINELTGTQNPTSNGATGCTSVKCTRYGRQYEFIDTAGLNESQFGTVKIQDAVCELVNLLTKSICGFNLLIFVNKSSYHDADNYNLFVKTITRNQIPVIGVVTGLEDEPNMQNWVEVKEHKFREHGMIFDAMVGTCFGNSNGILKNVFNELRPKSKQNVWDAICKHAKDQPVIFFDGGFSAMVRRVLNHLCDSAVIHGKFKVAESMKLVSRRLIDTFKSMNYSDADARSIALEIEGSVQDECNIQ
jgi:GTPase SAR1 family protein